MLSKSLQYQTAANTIDDLIKAVKNSFNNMERDVLNKVFLTHQMCMIEIFKVNGCNRYKLPHMGKDRLTREGELPVNLQCPLELVKTARQAFE